MSHIGLSTPLRDLVVGVLVLILGAAILKYSDLPTRVSVVETQQTAFEKAITSMDSKLDRIIERMEK